MLNARRSNQVMIGLIGNSLDIARMESRQPTFKPQRIGPQHLIQGSAEELRGPAELSERTLRYTAASALPEIDADRKPNQRVLAILLGSAHKATPAGGEITFAAAPSPPDAVTMRVRDNHQGMPPDR